ncbi:biotin--[acetyl-CoA-carboxylase] ligase [Chlamydiota bacterium]
MSINKKIMELFHANEDRFVSGEEIARSLALSRTAVWNHIEQLKKSGYQFDAIPNRGYKLVHIPDKLFPNEIAHGLTTNIVGKKIISYNSVPSTNDIAYELALNGAEEGTVVLAEYQTGGKGRLGRKWHAPTGKDILFSLVLRPSLEPYYITLLTVMSAIAVGECLQKELTTVPVAIKWPNDICINGKKICGILLEQKAEIDKIDFVIIGIGLNVNTEKEDFSQELTESAISLKIIQNKTIERIDLTRKLISYLDEKYQMIKEERFAELREEWLSFSNTHEKRIIIKQGKGILEGDAIGIDEKGALLLREDNGIIHTVLSGDLQLI